MALTNDLNQTLDPLDLFGKRAGDQAADLQSYGNQLGLQFQQENWDRLRQQDAPVRDFRNWALGLINQYQDGTYTPTADPGAAYRLKEQEQGIDAAAAAQGKLGSGGRLASIQDVRASSASNTLNTGINRLLQLAGYSVGDLNSNNNAMLNSAAGVSGAQMGVNAARDWADTAQQNGLVNLVNQGGYLAGYFGSGKGGGSGGGGNSNPAYDLGNGRFLAAG